MLGVVISYRELKRFKIVYINNILLVCYYCMFCPHAESLTA